MRVKDKLLKIKGRRQLRATDSIATTVAYDEEVPVPQAQTQSPQPPPKRRRLWSKTQQIE